MTQRRAGVVLALAGGLLVSFAGTRYVSGAVTQDRARREWDARVAHASVTNALVENSVTAWARPVHGAAVARLRIPHIGLDEIVFEGVDDDAMNGGPGHYPGSPLPGRAGNSIISAHRDRHFHKFEGLSVGDTVVTETETGATSWVITRRVVVGKERAILKPSKNPTLTLTTCWPIRYFGAAPDRLILTAVPVQQRS
jgi:LPXTG-site transpeptidase (sortase) family protein